MARESAIILYLMFEKGVYSSVQKRVHVLVQSSEIDSDIRHMTD
jgi:hypothetical protein